MTVERVCRSGRKNDDNFLLNRFLDELPIPKSIMDQASGSKRPRLQTSRKQAEGNPISDLGVPRLTDTANITETPNQTETPNPTDTPIVTETPNTPQRTVSFPALPPSSPTSLRSGRVGRSMTYKEPNFLPQLEMRGIFETEDSPLQWKKVIRTLNKKAQDLQPLSATAIEAFDKCLEAPGNEASIQGIIVVTLVDLHRVMRSPNTHGGLQCQFGAENPLPVLQGMAPNAVRLAVPWPDVVIGLRRSAFQQYLTSLIDMESIAAPLICTREIIFPCFTVEVKGEAGGIDARNQNRNNAAHMLRNLRQLYCKCFDEAQTEKQFDNTVRVITATVTRTMVTFYGHWTFQKEGEVYTHSKHVMSKSIQRISEKEWNKVYSVFQNAISYVVETTKKLVLEGLQSIKDGEPAAKRRCT